MSFKKNGGSIDRLVPDLFRYQKVLFFRDGALTPLRPLYHGQASLRHQSKKTLTEISTLIATFAVFSISFP
jgi:hypothetical protein